MSITLFDANRAPSVTRFPKVRSASGKKYRLRVPRPTLRHVSARLRVLRRDSKAYELRARREGILRNPFRDAYDGLLRRVRTFRRSLAEQSITQ